MANAPRDRSAWLEAAAKAPMGPRAKQTMAAPQGSAWMASAATSHVAVTAFRATRPGRWDIAGSFRPACPIQPVKPVTTPPAAGPACATVSDPVHSSRKTPCAGRRYARALCATRPPLVTGKEPVAKPSWSIVRPSFVSRVRVCRTAPATSTVRPVTNALNSTPMTSPPAFAESARMGNRAPIPANASRASAWTASAAPAVAPVLVGVAICPDRQDFV